MTKSIGIICMQDAINAAKNILGRLSHSSTFSHGGREDDSYYRIPLVDESNQGTDGPAEENSRKACQGISPPTAVPLPADSQK